MRQEVVQRDVPYEIRKIASKVVLKQAISSKHIVMKANLLLFDKRKDSRRCNGFGYTGNTMSDLAPQLSILGLSLDSAMASTIREIGRADKHEQILSLSNLAAIIESGRRLNPDLRVKINTVLNALNFTEDMSQLIQELAPDRWKVLRMLPTITSDLAIADHEFAEFVARHQQLGGIMAAEDNNDMIESYTMIDPHGHFFQNSLNRRGHRYSEEILVVGAEMAFRQICWQAEKFQSRYKARLGEVIA